LIIEKIQGLLTISKLLHHPQRIKSNQRSMKAHFLKIIEDFNKIP
jgi:hypothetical protein